MNCEELTKPLYHGSSTSFSNIDLSKSTPRKDFGRGFYTTADSFQAEKFARLKAKRMRASKGFVEIFHFRNSEMLNIKKFHSVDEEWLSFILHNRGYGGISGMDAYTVNSLSKPFDIVIGPIANDAVGLVLNQFVTGVYGDPKSDEAKSTAMRLLLTQKLRSQVFFGTENAISHLSFYGVYDVYID